MGHWRSMHERTVRAGLRRALALTMFTGVLAGAGAMAEPAHAQEEAGGVVRVVHGLRGLIADVYLNGQLVLPTFRPERATDPIDVPAGDHLVEIRVAGAAMKDRPLLSQSITVPAGFEGSLVAHLDGNGEPTLSTFGDDLDPVSPGRSRVVVRHTAAAEEVSVLLDDVPAIDAVAPSAEAAQLVAAGTYRLSVTPAGGGEPLAAPQSVDFAEGTANFMYLIGSQSDDTLGWAVVRVTDLHTAPTRIQTGDGSSNTTSPHETTWLVLAAATAFAAGSATVWTRSRRSAPSR